MCGRKLGMKRTRSRPATPGCKHQHQFLETLSGQDRDPAASVHPERFHPRRGSIDELAQRPKGDRQALINGVDRELVGMTVGEVRKSRSQRAERYFEPIGIWYDHR